MGYTKDLQDPLSCEAYLPLHLYGHTRYHPLGAIIQDSTFVETRPNSVAVKSRPDLNRVETRRDSNVVKARRDSKCKKKVYLIVGTSSLEKKLR